MADKPRYRIQTSEIYRLMDGYKIIGEFYDQITAERFAEMANEIETIASKYSHLDALLSKYPEDGTDFKSLVLFELWIAIKQAKGGSGE